MNTIKKYDKYVNTAFMTAVEPVVIDRADGVTYWDTEGNTYIDCFSGISVVNVGHSNKAVIDAAKAQIEKLVHCSSYFYHVQPVADLAEKLAAITPGKLQKSFFGNSGAEAVEGAARLAKRYTGGNEMIALSHSFHGRTYIGLSLTGNATRKYAGGPYAPGVAFAPAPYCYRCPLQYDNPDVCGLACAQMLEHVIKYNTSQNVAFFIAEPLMGEGGLILPPKGYFDVVKKILEMYDILFVADEVQSGIGRTGKMFAIEHYGVEPDIMALGKGIANGFPLSCFIASQEIADAFKPGDHLTTFGGNPVSCAASLASLQYQEENNLPESVAKKGEVLKDALRKINPTQLTIGEIRGKGLMVGIEIVKDSASKEPASSEAVKIKTAMRENGVMIGIGGVFGNVLRIQPPLTISEDELEQVVAILNKVMTI
jgi:4-aminobutyrate aminotransferase/(S)-3-amino-2-methylpropionate transaminase